MQQTYKGDPSSDTASSSLCCMLSDFCGSKPLLSFEIDFDIVVLLYISFCHTWQNKSDTSNRELQDQIDQSLQQARRHG